MTRLWLVAVVCKRSSASITVATAESKPKVMAVASRSLSIVLGTPMQLMPASWSCCAVAIEPSPPTMMAIDAQRFQNFARIRDDLLGDFRAIARADLGHEMPAVRRADDRSAARHDARGLAAAERM